MKKFLLLGDEAIAQAALDSGLSGIYAYPGTPSTEIMEYIQASKQASERNIHREWSANEKTAMEAALGMSYTGKRTMVCMKHVGLNVAADVFMNVAVTGVNGGFVVVSADDPSMHSSQNEQDSRYYGKFAMVPILEPSNQQEAYNMTRYAFELSEKFKVPVLIRITTRLAHSRAGVAITEGRKENQIQLPEDALQFILLPAFARAKYKKLLGHQVHFEKESQASAFNNFKDGDDHSLGIIACGLAYNYLMENFQDGSMPYPVLKICQYPLPQLKLEEIASKCHELIVLEEGYPFVEEMLLGFIGKGVKINGRLNGKLPRDGELNPDLVAKGLGLPVRSGKAIPEVVTKRPPALCKGCSHVDTFEALNESMSQFEKGHVFSDIGCYTLGALPPYTAIVSCVDMGASITMAKGAADAGLSPSVAVIGDSTFTHSGITGLLDAVNENSMITVIISDNSTTGMTGGQKSSATGRLEAICKGIGVDPDHVKVITPLKKYHEDNVEVMKEEINYNGVSVIISQRECIQVALKKKKEKPS
jgi:indolepyruvate ferredoxin oxidoreductase, alpha subunit